MPEGLPANYQWVSSDKGKHLRGRRKSGTWPEMRLRSELHRRGLRYHVAKRLGKGCTPDVLFSRARIAIFVDGCFWHSCPIHGRTHFTGPNAALWSAKLVRNRRNDERANGTARQHGYEVIRVWECEIREDVVAVGNRIESRLRSPRVS